jgi:hypothetical protein
MLLLPLPLNDCIDDTQLLQQLLLAVKGLVRLLVTTRLLITAGGYTIYLHHYTSPTHLPVLPVPLWTGV